jgi:putative transcriptional regulator
MPAPIAGATQMPLNDPADAVDIRPQTISILKTGKARAVRFSTLEAICELLECRPGDILAYQSAGKPVK